MMLKITALSQQVPVRTSPQLPPPGRPTTTSTPLVSGGGPKNFGEPIMSPLLQGKLFAHVTLMYSLIVVLCNATLVWLKFAA
jgi:hypothetical protein